MRLYVAGPMTGKPEWNHPEFDRVTALLREAGYEVVSPAEMDREAPEPLGTLSWEEAMKRDIAAICTRVDGIAVLPGHEQSRGARLETLIARKLKMPVLTYRSWVAIAKYDENKRSLPCS